MLIANHEGSNRGVPMLRGKGLIEYAKSEGSNRGVPMLKVRGLIEGSYAC